MPVSILIVVDFPAPFRPRNPYTHPVGTFKFKSLTAHFGP